MHDVKRKLVGKIRKSKTNDIGPLGMSFLIVALLIVGCLLVYSLVNALSLPTPYINGVSEEVSEENCVALLTADGVKPCKGDIPERYNEPRYVPPETTFADIKKKYQ